MPDIGQKAPDFNLLNQNRERVELRKALKKGKVLLVFYPGNDTPVCTAQLCDYRDHQGDFTQLGIQIYGISIGHYEKFEEFAKKISLNFPLLNDYDTRITRAYQAMSFTGAPKRALFLIDENQKILYKHVEFLPIFRKPSAELVEEIKKILVVAPAA